MKRRPRQTDQTTGENDASMPKYTIGVVSRLIGLPPQALRRYEETGLLEPARQSGKNRLYSDQDLAILREIVQLSDEGVNAVGIRYIIQMRVHVRILQREVQEVYGQPGAGASNGTSNSTSDSEPGTVEGEYREV